ncbi:MAG: hypothetical protein HXS54_10845 [Theionarchaea archaeon]|nr:hypothetical protein [Theionarchaea archaeon]
MRKMIVLLLVGLFVGTFISVLGENEENLSQDTFSFAEEDSGDTSPSNPVPCGGEGTGGGGVPG